MANHSNAGGSRHAVTPIAKRSGRTALLAALLGALLSAPTNAESLGGRVLDPQGAVVANAQLRLIDREGGLQRTVQSGPDGSYRFLSVPAATYLLEGEASDAQLAGSAEITVSGDASADLRLLISPSSVNVVVSASSTPRAQREVARALDTIDGRSMVLRNEFSLAEAIRAVPGIRVQQLRGPGSFVSVQTRGLRNHDTALLVDGMRFRDSASPQSDATIFFQDMPLVDADRVEILRGTSSSLYGSNAVGGVISVQSRQGGGAPHGEIRAEGGGLGMMRGVGRAAGGLAGDRLRYSGGLSHVNVTRGHRGGSPFRNSSAQLSTQAALRPNLLLSGRVWVSDSFRSLVESPAFPDAVVANFPASGIVRARALPLSQLERFERGESFEAGSSTFVPDQLDPDSRLSSAFLVTAVTLRYDPSPGSSYQLSYQLLRTGRTNHDGPAGPSPFDPPVSAESQFDGRNDMVLARTDHRVGNSHLLSLGYEFEGEGYSNFNTDESASPVVSSSEIEQAGHAVFVQDQIRLLEGRLHLTLSGRAQRYALEAPRYSGESGPYGSAPASDVPGAYTGDFAIAYFVPASQTKFRGHVGNGFRAPSLYERFGGSFSTYAGSFSYWGDPRLEPERSVSADFGIDQWLLDSKVRVSGTLYYTDLSETIFFDFANFPLNDPFGRFGGYRNTGGGIARGVEMGAQAALSASTSLRGSYTYVNSDSRTPTIGADYFLVPGTSAHVYAATASQWIGSRVNVTFDVFATSDYILSPYGARSRQLSFGGPLKADLVLRYAVPLAEGKRVEIYGKVENVFNADYYEDGFASPGAWMIGGIRYQF